MLSYIKAANDLLPYKATSGYLDIKLGLQIYNKNDVIAAGSFSAKYIKCGIFYIKVLKNAII